MIVRTSPRWRGARFAGREFGDCKSCTRVAEVVDGFQGGDGTADDEKEDFCTVTNNQVS